MSIAKDFNVTRATISLIKQKAKHPERYERNLTKRMTKKEAAKLKHALDHTLPADHGLDTGSSPRSWTLKRGFTLAGKLFGKTPSVRVMKEYVGKQAASKGSRNSNLKREHVNH